MVTGSHVTFRSPSTSTSRDTMPTSHILIHLVSPSVPILQVTKTRSDRKKIGTPSPTAVLTSPVRNTAIQLGVYLQLTLPLSFN
jgi:hypothetical protein